MRRRSDRPSSTRTARRDPAPARLRRAGPRGTFAPDERRNRSDMTEMVRTKVLVAGDAAARPAGLVATLEQAGFRVEDVPPAGDLAAAAAAAAPDAVLLCVG